MAVFKALPELLDAAGSPLAHQLLRMTTCLFSENYLTWAKKGGQEFLGSSQLSQAALLPSTPPPLTCGTSSLSPDLACQANLPRHYSFMYPWKSDKKLAGPPEVTQLK